MTVWLVRGGRFGEREQLALDQGLAIIGWEELPDLTPITSREGMDALMRQTYPDAKPNTISNFVGQVWAFRQRIQPDDLVVLPLKTQGSIAVGKVTGSYAYRSDLPGDARHVRSVHWLRKDLPRTVFDQDVLYSLGAAMTVCQIQRNGADQRIRAVVEGKPPKPDVKPGNGDGPEPVNIEEIASDQVRAFITQRFKGHGLARLVAEILKAQGYRAYASPAGADGGVDIIAGQGAMGFDHPRLCVQVKSGDGPLDVGALRELQGVMKNFGASQGLLVSWGGFRQSVLTESRRLYFDLRLWNAEDLLRALFACYDQLDAAVQAELPLKRIWTLVAEE